MSSDQYPYHHTLAESQSTLAVDGYVWALADVTPQLWCSTFNPTTIQVSDSTNTVETKGTA